MKCSCLVEYWRNGKRLEAIGMVGALLLCLIFLVAGAGKLITPADFAVAIHRYQLAPESLVSLLAIYLPWIEISTALALLFRSYRRAAAGLLLVILFAFTYGIVSAMARGLNVACGCFSTSPDAAAANWLSVLRNLLLMALTLVVFISARRTCPQARPPANP